MRPDTLTVTEERGGNMLQLIDTGKDFMNNTFIAKSLRPTLIKMVLHEAEKLL